MDNESKIVCRKCQGPHLTIKCGKEKENKVEEKIKIQIDEKPREPRRDFKDRDQGKTSFPLAGLIFQKKINPDHHQPRDQPYPRRDFKSTKHGKVKLSNLPNDILEDDLYELLKDWGQVYKLNLVSRDNYSGQGGTTRSTAAYIEFRAEEQADYFLKAFDNTACNNQILVVEKLLE
jgi:RNA recognition motif-containing protein